MLHEAISELEIKLHNYTTNEPIWAKEGNEAQAALCARYRISIQKALAILNGIQSMVDSQ